VSKIFVLMEHPDPPDSRPLAGFPTEEPISEYRIIYRIQGDARKVTLDGKRNDAEVCRELEGLR